MMGKVKKTDDGARIARLLYNFCMRHDTWDNSEWFIDAYPVVALEDMCFWTENICFMRDLPLPAAYEEAKGLMSLPLATAMDLERWEKSKLRGRVYPQDRIAANVDPKWMFPEDGSEPDPASYEGKYIEPLG